MFILKCMIEFSRYKTKQDEVLTLYSFNDMHIFPHIKLFKTKCVQLLTD